MIGNALKMLRLKSLQSVWRSFAFWLRRRMPRGLFVRSLLIIVLPMIILQAVVAYVFMERHWQLVTGRLSVAVTRDIAALIEVLNTYPQDPNYSEIYRIARSPLEMEIFIEKGSTLPVKLPTPFFSILDSILSKEIEKRIGKPYWINTFGISRKVEIRILLDDNRTLRVLAPIDSAYASNSHIFLVWMVSVSLVLIVIAVLFLRGQIRPILRLAKAAESFGKGQKTPQDFTPSGADEIRRASLAFILMRERIERQMEQRTAMLSGVSHDLRTILTRFKLQLALFGDSKETEELSKDVADMQAMLEGYLAFARGENEDEDVHETSLHECFARFNAQAELEDKELAVSIEGSDIVAVRPNAFNRLVSNLVSNAFQHAKRVDISVQSGLKWLVVTVDDDGPGIPEDMREEVFKPFFRMDAARNLNASGTGLGLSIARDIARGHGGNVTLSESAMGGLRATVRIPV